MEKTMKDAMAIFEKLTKICNDTNRISFKVEISSIGFVNLIGRGFDDRKFNVSLNINYAIVNCASNRLTTKKLAESPVDYKYGTGKNIDTAVKRLLRKILSPRNTFIQILGQSIYVISWDAKKNDFKKEVASF
ncbi:hypothetical protein K9M48_03195 [Candidatus Gracilibacteria bacterium]|nr:hypothetical protein [Candidatus Gracilibacteria bacterium]